MANALCPPRGPGTPAARSCLLVPSPLRGLPEEELADSRLFGDYHRTLSYGAAFSEKVSGLWFHLSCKPGAMRSGQFIEMMGAGL
jgi:hypothetical protein